ncbi:MAG: hypothetical protein H6684_10295 [Deltaproteobacteria bacterium]|nr:hypothetical protein [bacterium]MCB9480176.1 hypothetical protein [Deltaproteobacteria bacterium]MCB9489108.1 hypothetical protein [Deltaproteobacteria bacterium]
MRNITLILTVAALFAFSALTVVGCEGDEYDQQTRSLDYEDGTGAKDRDEDQNCLQDDLQIRDCFDACACCIYSPEGEDHEELYSCVTECNDTLLLIDNIEETRKADITQYKECVVGCWSICNKPDKEETCYDECKGYLGLE